MGIFSEDTIMSVDFTAVGYVEGYAIRFGFLCLCLDYLGCHYVGGPNGEEEVIGMN